MFHDARRLPPGARLDADICVVGAGAAGIALTRALRRSGLRICVLESGGLAVDQASQALAEGEIGAMPYPPLQRGRLRCFGGTTGHWAGWCRPPRHRNFLARRWVPHSGWPFELDALEPYLRQAHEICGLGPYDYRPAAWATPPSREPLPLARSSLETAVTQFSLPVRFGEAYRAELEGAHEVGVWLHATVLDFELDPRGRRVLRAIAAATDGTRFTVRARIYVLATGGIENARLLLVASASRPGALGNRYDLVGRFFMDHLKVEVGRFQPVDGELPLGFYQRHVVRGTPIKGHLCFAEEVLERERLLECYFELEPSEDGHRGLGRSVWALASGQPLTRRPPVSWVVMLRVDPAPNPASRVVLGEQRDALGLPRPRVELRYGEHERRAVARGVRLLAHELGRRGLGRLQLGPGASGMWPPPAGTAVITGYHHMGTTRMHADPRQGVVDPTGCVHGMRNLYIAGSSIFPGYEGYPTLLIVALALRLGAHLRSRLA